MVTVESGADLRRDARGVLTDPVYPTHPAREALLAE